MEEVRPGVSRRWGTEAWKSSARGAANQGKTWPPSEQINTRTEPVWRSGGMRPETGGKVRQECSAMVAENNSEPPPPIRAN